MKIICIGRNYAAHAAELNNEKPEEPVIFLKPDSAILRPKFPFYRPAFSDDIHYECEVVLRINKVGKAIEQKFAHRYYDTIGLGIDFTARDLQSKLKAKGLPWEISKGFDQSCFVSEFFSKENYDLNALPFQLKVNGEIRQDGNTENMLFPPDEIIAYVSQFYTLKKGDLIFTGTPAGVGKVEENDVLEGFLADEKVFEIRIK